MKNGNANGRLDGRFDRRLSALFQMRFVAIVAFIVVAAAMRLIPHPPNFSPIAAMALFGGAYLGRRSLSLLLPLAALFLSDLVLGFHSLMPVVYAAFVLVALLGSWLKTERKALRVAGASLAGSLLFFAITNLAVWFESGMYERTAQGLITCFVAALPFLQNSLAGDLFFTTVLFGGFALAEKAVPQLREA